MSKFEECEKEMANIVHGCIFAIRYVDHLPSDEMKKDVLTIATEFFQRAAQIQMMNSATNGFTNKDLNEVLHEVLFIGETNHEELKRKQIQFSNLVNLVSDHVPEKAK